MSKRWIPYKHSNGIAIYYHENITEGHEFVGGEYMVSSIVRGTPEQCLAALTHSSSTTTILGPATAVEVLSRQGDAQVGRECGILTSFMAVNAQSIRDCATSKRCSRMHRWG
jgi:hypothetical protein